MPYYRRRKYPRRRYRKRTGGFNYRSAWNMAKMAWRGVKYIKGLVNSEMLKLDTSATVNPSTTGAVVHLSAITAGDSDSGRTGNSIYVRSLYCRHSMEINASATQTFIRIIHFIDTQQIGDTAPGVTDVLENATVNAPLNNATVGRFKILSDRIVQLDNVGKKLNFMKCFHVMRHHIRYNGTAATDQQKGAVYLLHLSSEATNTPSLTYWTRLNYHDN